MLLPDAALFSMKVMFATPCYISAVSMNYTIGIFDLVMHTKRFGPECILHMHSESLITRARNKMVLRFLEDESLTHLFWIDSDIGFTPQAVCRLLLADRDVVAGVYPMKSMHWPKEGLPQGTTREQFEVRYGEYPFNEMGKMSRYSDADGFAEVAEAPTGFMCIKRHVFYKMMQHYPHLNYVPDGPGPHPQAHLHWLFFDCMVDPDSRRYLSEDFAFCRRWRDIGGKVYVDLNSRLQHAGQHLYRGDLIESLKLQDRW
jgi:hypothetical protein